jgi:hypothetical protein
MKLVLAKLFNELSEFDSKMTDAMEKLANYITSSAKETMNMVNLENYYDVNEFIKNERIKMNQLGLAISDTIVAPYRLEAEFIRVSGSL